MVTGDNLQTAKAIAAECGIITEDGTSIEGKDFRVMGLEEQYALIPTLDVRASMFAIFILFPQQTASHVKQVKIHSLL